jgi:diguanylate cyclase (GGDEF)-like protein
MTSKEKSALSTKQQQLTIVDSLAEITRYQDKHIIEKSLVKTIHDLYPDARLRFFRVEEKEGRITIHLLSFAEQGAIDACLNHSQLKKINSDLLNDMFRKVIDSGSIEMFPCEDENNWHVVYPAFDVHDDIFAILLFTTPQPNFTEQKLLHGILKVYSNYLSLIDKSERDKLTGLYNRETLDDQIIKILVHGTANEYEIDHDEILSNERRNLDRKRAFLGMVDIDYFKKINDSLGHLYGDEVLVLIAQLMQENFTREEDYVFRYGGEEFVILIHANNETDALGAFERLRINIADHSFPQIDQVTVSIGFEEITTQESPHEIIFAADQALYYAKHAGRNRTDSYQKLLSTNKIAPPKKPQTGKIEFF